jgi:hypothetical protein
MTVCPRTTANSVALRPANDGVVGVRPFQAEEAESRSESGFETARPISVYHTSEHGHRAFEITWKLRQNTPEPEPGRFLPESLGSRTRVGSRRADGMLGQHVRCQVCTSSYAKGTRFSLREGKGKSYLPLPLIARTKIAKTTQARCVDHCRDDVTHTSGQTTLEGGSAQHRHLDGWVIEQPRRIGE